MARPDVLRGQGAVIRIRAGAKPSMLVTYDKAAATGRAGVQQLHKRAPAAAIFLSKPLVSPALSHSLLFLGGGGGGGGHLSRPAAASRRQFCSAAVVVVPIRSRKMHALRPAGHVTVPPSAISVLSIAFSNLCSAVTDLVSAVSILLSDISVLLIASSQTCLALS